jgi:uncharacterized protein (DUF1697 family)
VTATHQVALLRGINLGRSKRIAMADLRALVEALGYEDVRTHLQSGNVVYKAPVPPAQAGNAIEGALGSKLGMDVRVLVRTDKDLASVVDRNPLADVATDPTRLLVTFLSGKPDPKRLRALDPGDFEPDVFRAGDREIYVWCPNGVGKTMLGHAFWERYLGLTATARNWNTVTKLLALADAVAA